MQEKFNTQKRVRDTCTQTQSHAHRHTITEKDTQRARLTAGAGAVGGIALKGLAVGGAEGGLGSGSDGVGGGERDADGVDRVHSEPVQGEKTRGVSWGKNERKGSANMQP